MPCICAAESSQGVLLKCTTQKERVPPPCLVHTGGGGLETQPCSIPDVQKLGAHKFHWHPVLKPLISLAQWAGLVPDRASTVARCTCWLEDTWSWCQQRGTQRMSGTRAVVTSVYHVYCITTLVTKHICNIWHQESNHCAALS